MLGKQHHIAIIASSWEKAKDFYIDKLGFELTREVYRPAQDDYLRMLSLGETTLELFIRPDAPQRVNNPEAMGLRHLAFRVEDAVAAAAWLNARASKRNPSGRIWSTAVSSPFSKTPTACPWRSTNNEK